MTLRSFAPASLSRVAAESMQATPRCLICQVLNSAGEEATLLQPSFAFDFASSPVRNLQPWRKGPRVWKVMPHLVHPQTGDCCVLSACFRGGACAMGLFTALRCSIFFIIRKPLMCVVLSFRVCLQNFRYLGKRNIVR